MALIKSLYIVLLASICQESNVSQASEHLKPLEFLVGTWAGHGENQVQGSYVETHTFSWIQGGSFLKADYLLKDGDKVVWSAMSIIGYDTCKKKLVGYGFAKDGSIAQGEEVPSDKKNVWVMENRISMHGTLKEDRATIEKIDEDTFVGTTESKKDGKYTFLGKSTFKRKK